MKQPKKLTRKQKEILSKRYPSLDQSLYGLLKDGTEEFTIVHRLTKEIKTYRY